MGPKTPKPQKYEKIFNIFFIFSKTVISISSGVFIFAGSSCDRSMVILDLGTTWSIDINSSLLILVVEIILGASTWTSWHLFWIRHHHLLLSIISIGLKTFLTCSVILLIVILRKMIWVNH